MATTFVNKNQDVPELHVSSTSRSSAVQLKSVRSVRMLQQLVVVVLGHGHARLLYHAAGRC